MNEPASIDAAEHVHDLLSDYLNGDLTDRERQTVEAHLANCGACRRDHDSLRLTIQLVHQVPLRAVPRPFTISAPPRRHWSIAWLRVSTSALAALFVAVLALQLALPTGAHPTASTSRAVDAAARVESAGSRASSTAPVAAPAAAAQSAPAGDTAVASDGTTAKSVPATALAPTPAPLPPSIGNGQVVTVPVRPRLPTWYLPMLVTVGVLLVASLAGLIWVTVRR